MNRAFRLGLYAALTAAAVLLAAGVAGVLVLRSEWLRDRVRERIVAEAENASGGRAELASFDFNWRELRATLRGFVLHGTESAGAAPLFRAESFEVGLRIVSALRRDIDIASLAVNRPEVSLIVGPDGRTNLPRPKTASGRNPVEQILSLAVGEFSLDGGLLTVNERRYRLDFRGRGLGARVFYESAAPRYLGEVAVRELLASMPGGRSIGGSARLAGTLERDRVGLSQVELTSGRSRLRFSGAVESLKAPRLAGEIDALATIEDLERVIDLPLRRQGEIRVAGKGWFAGTGEYALAGRVEGKNLGVASHGIRANAGRLSGSLRMEPGTVAVDGLEVAALGGIFAGRAHLDGWRQLSVEGTIRGVTVAALGSVHAKAASIPWNGSVRGSVKLRTELSAARARNTELDAELAVAAGEGANPVSGNVTLSYVQKRAQVRFAPSRLATAATDVNFGGVLGERLRVDLRTTALDDLLTAARALREDAPASLPVRLERGSASFQGLILGPLDQPVIRGRVAAGKLRYEGRLIERVAAGIDLSQSALHADSLAVEWQGARLTGSGGVSLAAWRLSGESSVKASVHLEGADLKTLAHETGNNFEAAGTLSADAQIDGTVSRPELTANLSVLKLQAAGESFDSARARVQFTPGTLEVAGGRLEAGKTRLDLALSHRFPEEDIRSGSLSFEAATDRLPLASLKLARSLGFDFDGIAAGKVAGKAVLANGAARLETLDGRISVKEISLAKRPVGTLDILLATKHGKLSAAAEGKFLGAAVKGSGEWGLSGGYTGGGTIRLAALRFSDLRRLAVPELRFPFDGLVEGQISLKGSLLKPEATEGEVRIQTLQLRPLEKEAALPDAAKGLWLRNAEPLVAALDGKGIHIRSARFVARDTSLEVLGTFSTQARNAWNLQIRGGLDLAIVSSLYPELVAAGRAVLNASVRGTVGAPVFGGRMELQKASVFLTGVPSGIENANGVLSFDRNRATIEHLTAQAGGGQLRLSGFVGIGGPELVYRLQAEAEKVRIRYPEGVSTTSTASLNLTGTSTRSLLAGTATIERAAFNPRTDIGSMLAESVRPMTTPVPSNPLLAAMQFDIRVTSSPALEVQTSLASNIQAEADLRLRGSAAKPVVLGRVSVNQGEIQFFGNKYSITRGGISFYNPARIEPVLDMNLETRVRGVIVNLAFTGPMSKLNMSYRSDPPLQSQEVIALLAVGRAPGSNPTQAAAQLTYSQGGLPSGTESLVGQAISTPISSRLQRFFGVSRLKIDPHLTGTAITPQARLTVEQQISRDITLTYVTNLSETKEQLVRIEWDLNRQWSVVALRDENGTFGVDFLYKKRFR